MTANTASDERFFSELPEVLNFDEVLSRDGYADAPSSWHVVITDVRGSTRAIEEGRYREVNALGVASIIAVRNAVPDLELPYVFGGDGATLLIPGTRLETVSSALRGARELANETFDLELRVACVPVAKLLASGYPVRVQRYRLSQHVALAMFAGQGFQVAETWAKDERLAAEFVLGQGPAEASFEGFECAWQPLPSQNGEIACLLVVALGDDDAAREGIYRTVLAFLEEVVQGHIQVPVSTNSLLPLPVLGDYSVEARIRSKASAGPGFRRARTYARTRMAVGRSLMALGVDAFGFDGKRYREEFIGNTDFRKFDETLRMVLDLSAEQCAALEVWLDEQVSNRRLAYGLHRSKAALATCMVKSYHGDHVHFVDGEDGGYALAARGLKARLKQLGEP